MEEVGVFDEAREVAKLARALIVTPILPPLPAPPSPPLTGRRFVLEDDEILSLGDYRLRVMVIRDRQAMTCQRWQYLELLNLWERTQSGGDVPCRQR